MRLQVNVLSPVTGHSGSGQAIRWVSRVGMVMDLVGVEFRYATRLWNRLLWCTYTDTGHDSCGGISTHLS